MALLECRTGSEVIENYRQVKARLRQLKSPEPPPSPEPEPTPETIKVEIVEVIEEAAVTIHKQEPEPPNTIIHPSVARISELVSHRFNITKADLVSQRRTNHIVRPRQIVMYLARRLTLHSLPSIGKFLGGRDHTTVLHAVQKIEMIRSIDPDMDAALTELEAKLTTKSA